MLFILSVFIGATIGGIIRANRLDELKTSLPDIQVANTTTPTPSVNSTPVTRRALIVDPIVVDITDTVQTASLIAEVQVRTIHPGVFNTDTGGTPSVALQDDPTLEQDTQWMIFRMIEFDVINVLKGQSSLEAIVSPLLGGTAGAHELGFGGVTIGSLAAQDRAMIFVTEDIYTDAVYPDAAVPWLRRAALLRDSLIQNGEVARFAYPNATYKYNMQSQEAYSNEIFNHYSISNLQTTVANLLANSTPTPSPTP